MTEFREQFWADAAELFDRKDKEYRHGAPPLNNFRECGELLGLRPSYVALVFAYKHFRAVCSHVRNPRPDGELTEPIRGRLLDLANFVWVLAALLEEEGNEEGCRER